MVSDKILWLWNGTCVNYCDHPDGLVLTPSSDIGGNWNIATAAPANNTQGYVGQAFGGGAYIEAKIKFDPTTVNFSQGFPAFWGFSIEHAANQGADHPAGTPAGFQHFIEDDFFELDISWASSIAYGTSIHDWYGIIRRHGRRDIAMDHLISAT